MAILYVWLFLLQLYCHLIAMKNYIYRMLNNHSIAYFWTTKMARLLLYNSPKWMHSSLLVICSCIQVLLLLTNAYRSAIVYQSIYYSARRHWERCSRPENKGNWSHTLEAYMLNDALAARILDRFCLRDIFEYFIGQARQPSDFLSGQGQRDHQSRCTWYGWS